MMGGCLALATIIFTHIDHPPTTGATFAMSGYMGVGDGGENGCWRVHGHTGVIAGACIQVGQRGV